MDSKVLLVDDHRLFLEGLQYLLETYQIQVVGKAKDGKEALRKTRELKPDIILMDIKMPESSGLEALKLIKAEFPQIKVAMLTTSEEESDLFAAIQFGASGYLLKDTSAEVLVETLEGLEKGEVAIFPDVASKILDVFQGKVHEKTDSGPEETLLTTRQTEILELVAKGKTYKEIGEELYLSARTVKYHIGRIIELLHLENKAQVISYAAQKGLLEKK